MSGNNSGRRQQGNSVVPSTVGRLGVNGFWVRDYGGGSLLNSRAFFSFFPCNHFINIYKIFFFFRRFNYCTCR
jgi:hypothetical protein